MNGVERARLLLVDDHAIVRAGYRHLLEHQGRYVVVGEAESADEAYALFVGSRPDVVITDITMPGASGVEVIRRILRLDVAARVLVFSMHLSPAFASAALRAGALGYVTKSSRPTELLTAIDAVFARQKALSSDIARALSAAPFVDGRRLIDGLTPREFDVLCMLIAPTAIEEIARALHLSVKTVNNLHYQIKSKLGVGSDIELTRLALSSGLEGSGTAVRR
jgi:two-component system invasion response regulator UvrY